MKQILLALGSVLAITSTAAASRNIVCKAVSSSSGEIGQVQILDNKVIVSGGFLHKPNELPIDSEVNGLITAKGVAITFDNHYGCLRNATIIAEFREPFGAGYMEVVNVKTCSGGSTPDSLCKPSNPEPRQ